MHVKPRHGSRCGRLHVALAQGQNAGVVASAADIAAGSMDEDHPYIQDS